jgi:hypothetical protein
VGVGARELTARGRLAQAASRLRPLGPALLACAVGLLPMTTCLVRLVVGLPCPACGLTRAGLLFVHGDLADAARMHPAFFPLLAALAVVTCAALFATDAAFSRASRWSLNFAAVALLLVWLIRFAGAFGGPVPP